MTQQTINVGSAPNDGTGDPARIAFTKSNDNFTELYSAVRAANQVFYCDPTDAADVATYKRLLLTPSTHAESTVAVSCTGTGDVLVGAFITDPGIPGAIEYPAGSAYRRLYGSVSAGVARFHLQVYTRTTGGVETLARDEFSNSFSDTSATLQEWLATPTSAGVLTTTDRIVGKIYAQRVSGPTSITVTFYAEGSAHASQIQTTITTGSSAPISASPPLALTGGNLTIDLSGSPQGRLTLQTTTPVMTTTQAGKIIIYYPPYVGNKVPIYDGTTMAMTTFAELSVAIADSIKSPAAIGASKVNDWFVWNDAGTVRIGHGPDWTSDTARSAGTALVMVNGILLNNAAITNGPAASRGTYVGTTRSNASSQLDWILPSAAAGGGKGTLGIWNAYNRVLAGGACIDTTASWVTASTTIRAKNNSANNAIAFVSGLQEDVAQAVNAHGLVTNASDNTTILCGIGVDTTTAFTSPGGQGGGGANLNAGVPRADHSAQSFGYHTWSAVEATNAATNTQTYGTIAGPPARNNSHLTFQFPM